MSELIFPFIALILSMICSLIILPHLLTLCYKRGLYDLPNERKVHKNSIPRLGGLIFAPATLVGTLGTIGIMHLLDVKTPDTFQFSSILFGCGALLIYFVGAIDDLVGCSAHIKFAIQFITAILFPLCGLQLDSLYGLLGIYELPEIVSFALTVFLVLLIVNAINLIDGIDGLAAGLSLIALVCYCVLFHNIHIPCFVLITAALIGSIIVFLPFNLWGTVKNKRKTFMGDSGSLLLGIVLAYFTMKYAMNESPTLPQHADGLVMAYTLTLVPCFDLCRVALCRLMKGQSIFHPDKTHIHHKLMAAGASMHSALIIILALQIAYILVNTVLFYCEVDMLWIMLIDIATFTALHIYLPIQNVEDK